MSTLVTLCKHRKGLVISPALDEILEVLAPIYALFFLVLELRYGLSDDIRQEVDEPSPWLHLCSVCWKRKAVLRHFEQRDSQ